MCEVSDKLKLCTCNSDIIRLKNYWAYYKKAPGKVSFIIGEPMMPAQIDPKVKSFNTKLLKGLLNDGNVFDFELTPEPGDGLLIAFDLAKTGEDCSMMYYAFVYRQNKWTSCAFDTFDWEHRFDQEKYGKITNALKNNPRK